jgi:hypothetical protein
MITRRALLLAATASAALAPLGGCAPVPPGPATDQEIAQLAQAIAGLSPDVDPAEARQAARMAFAESQRLTGVYQITDPPLIHNTKVNAGIRPRGLCYHWAEDLERHLSSAGFDSLEITRAIANARNPLVIDHSTAVIIPRGAPMQAGIVLDPWRYGGRLFWAPVMADPRYRWEPRAQVLRARKRRG